jgi:hypothetical protein
MTYRIKPIQDLEACKQNALRQHVLNLVLFFLLVFAIVEAMLVS